MQPTSGQGGGGVGGMASGGVAGFMEAAAGAAGEPEQTPSGFYLEAESAELSGGFTIETDPAASNGQYILPPAVAVKDDVEGPAHARYTFNVEQDGDYLIWGRIYSPSIANNRFHVQVDGGQMYLWRMTVGNIWYWDDVHDNLHYNDPLHFQLTAGPHELVISNVAVGERLDRLYITSNGDEPPGNNTKCRPPHSIDLDGVCHQSCGTQAMPDMPTTCDCAGRLDHFEAYDCGGGFCCFTQMP